MVGNEEPKALAVFFSNRGTMPAAFFSSMVTAASCNREASGKELSS